MKGLERCVAQNVLCSSVNAITPYRKHWLVETDDQKWIAKKVTNVNKIVWWERVDSELRSRGFQEMPVMKTDGEKWVFTAFVEGKSGTYTQLDEVIKKVRVLARFHEVSQGLSVPFEKMSMSPFYNRLYRRLERFYDVLNNAHRLDGELGRLVRVHGKDFYFDGLKVWEQLRQSPLVQLTQRDRGMGNLTHRDLAAHNWMMDKDGQPWLIDWDTAAYDLQLGDIWQMYSRILTENGWSDEWSGKILFQYEQIRPLRPMEKQMLVLLLAFPNEFYREVAGLAFRQRGYTLDRTLPYIKKIIASRDRWQDQLKRLGYW